MAESEKIASELPVLHVVYSFCKTSNDCENIRSDYCAR